MKKSKILATVLAGTMLLSAAFTMQSSAAAMDMVKDGKFPAGTTAWKCVDDEGKTVAAEKAVKFEAGKAVFSEDTQNWIHLDQTVKVEPKTKYQFSITYKLTAGAFRLDVLAPGAEKANEISCDMYEKGVRAKYGTEQTFETIITTADGQTEFRLDIRNQCGDLGKAVGEITNISFVELDANLKPVDGTPEHPEESDKNDSNKGDSPITGVVFPVVALCVALTSAGALAVSKKK